ncbi:MAG: hypothetical protein M3N51_10795, partial [Actinomycetota bacterium]|nr:hypothetical protein [Actinomycetota bacterium]
HPPYPSRASGRHRNAKSRGRGRLPLYTVGTVPMDRKARGALMVLAVLAAGWAAYRRRPVRPPQRLGQWEPVER